MRHLSCQIPDPMHACCRIARNCMEAGKGWIELFGGEVGVWTYAATKLGEAVYVAVLVREPGRIPCAFHLPNSSLLPSSCRCNIFNSCAGSPSHSLAMSDLGRSRATTCMNEHFGIQSRSHQRFMNQLKQDASRRWHEPPRKLYRRSPPDICSQTLGSP